MLDYFKRPEVLAAIVGGIITTILVPPLIRLAKSVLLWFPNRVGASFKDLFKFAKDFKKAKDDPLAAIVFCARQLSLLILNVALGLPSLFLAYVFATSDNGVVTMYRLVFLLLSCSAVLLFTWRGLKCYFAIGVIYQSVINPSSRTTAAPTAQAITTEPPPVAATEPHEKARDSG